MKLITLLAATAVLFSQFSFATSAFEPNFGFSHYLTGNLEEIEVDPKSHLAEMFITAAIVNVDFTTQDITVGLYTIQQCLMWGSVEDCPPAQMVRDFTVSLQAAETDDCNRVFYQGSYDARPADGDKVTITVIDNSEMTCDAPHGVLATEVHVQVDLGGFRIDPTPTSYYHRFYGSEALMEIQ